MTTELNSTPITNVLTAPLSTWNGGGSGSGSGNGADAVDAVDAMDALFAKLEAMKRDGSFCWKRRFPVAPFRLRPLHFDVSCTASLLMDALNRVLKTHGFAFDLMPHVSLVQVHGHAHDALFCGEIWIYRRHPGPEDLDEDTPHDFVVEICRHGGEDGFLAHSLFRKLHHALCSSADHGEEEEQEERVYDDLMSDYLMNAISGDLDNFDGLPLESRTYDDLCGWAVQGV